MITIIKKACTGDKDKCFTVIRTYQSYLVDLIDSDLYHFYDDGKCMASLRIYEDFEFEVPCFPTDLHLKVGSETYKKLSASKEDTKSNIACVERLVG